MLKEKIEDSKSQRSFYLSKNCSFFLKSLGSQFRIVFENRGHVLVVFRGPLLALRCFPIRLPVLKCQLPASLVFHGPDALLLQVLVDLVVVDAVDRHRPPQLLELRVDLEVCRVVVVKDDLLLVRWPRQHDHLLLVDQLLHDLLTAWQ